MRVKKVLYIPFIFMIAFTLCSCGVLQRRDSEESSSQVSALTVPEEIEISETAQGESESPEKKEESEVSDGIGGLQEEAAAVSVSVKVPDVEGRPQDEGVSILEALNFETLIVEKKSDAVEKGFIISQSPTGGKSAEEGSAVTLYVSRGNNKKKSSDTKTDVATVTPVPTAEPATVPYTSRDRSYAAVYYPPEDINVRAQPGYTSARVGTLGAGTTLYFYGEVGQGYGSDGVLHDWYFIETDQGINGYVRSDLISVLSALPSQPSYPIVYAGKDINLRAEPMHESGLVATVTGTLYYLGETGYGYGSDGVYHEWSKVMTPDGTIGWARSDLLVW